ncbi:unnamed protein product [Rotaria socialis]
MQVYRTTTDGKADRRSDVNSKHLSFFNLAVLKVLINYVLTHRRYQANEILQEKPIQQAVNSSVSVKEHENHQHY